MKCDYEPHPELECEAGYVRQLHDAIIHEAKKVTGRIRKAYRKPSRKKSARQSDDAYKNFRVDPVQRDMAYMGSCVSTTRTTAKHVEQRPTPKSIVFEEELRLRKFLRDNLRPEDRVLLERLDYYLQPLCERAKRIKEATK